MPDSPKMKMKTKERKPETWGSIYRNSLARGDDHGYAAFLADQWEKRNAKKANRSTSK